MSSKRTKFVISSIIIVLALSWLAVSGFNESKAYYKTVDELLAMGDEAHRVRLKVAGDVVKGSIDRSGRTVKFRIEQNGRTLDVNYIGSETLPDTFVDGVQAVAEGTYTKDRVFVAKKIQAKCASKYEAKKTIPAEQADGKPAN